METIAPNPIIGLSIFAVWIVLLTLYCIYLTLKMRRLTSPTQLQAVEIDQSRLGTLEKRVDVLTLKSKRYIQKVGVVRYNPFKDLGGDQSFAVALLDIKGNGVVVSSLHSRVTTRTFAKPIVEGKSLTQDLSKEEEHAIELAFAKR